MADPDGMAEVERIQNECNSTSQELVDQGYTVGFSCPRCGSSYQLKNGKLPVELSSCQVYGCDGRLHSWAFSPETPV